ncbi:hypothetical protein AB0P12_15375 [Streptomyces subrutilus]|uniref:hypothetical protein n=1 Tax=Streptomyces subrutilus TaxID=36818 RepID=UPI0033CBCE18
MQETTFAPPPQATARVPRPLGPAWTESDSPIYDRLEREWLRAGRAVPRPAGPPGRRCEEQGDRFGRA